MQKVIVHWLRRDLRLVDNTALRHALSGDTKVMIIYIFDPDLLSRWQTDNPRITFIHDRLTHIDQKLQEKGSGLHVFFDKPEVVFQSLIKAYDVQSVYANKDYEPKARERDDAIQNLIKKHDIELHLMKDQVIFEESEIAKADGTPYTVYTPYKNKWRAYYEKQTHYPDHRNNYDSLLQERRPIPSLQDLGCVRSSVLPPACDLNHLKNYAHDRDYPYRDATSRIGVYLRFGTVSIRKIVETMIEKNPAFVDELIWREFFMQILFHFPHVVSQSFRLKYDQIEWRNNQDEFQAWCDGMTGYPLVDAGMRELNTTGYMHNRVRMVVASFLTKHLLVDWRWWEKYFSEKLLDYELSSNNGNWQWAAGTGCDAAPYFRVFNPQAQFEKFDPKGEYVKKWVSEYGTSDYPDPIVEHKMARKRAIDTYKKALDNN